MIHEFQFTKNILIIDVSMTLHKTKLKCITSVIVCNIATNVKYNL